MFSPLNDGQLYRYLLYVWDEFGSHVPENHLIGRYFAVIYYADLLKKKPKLFVGKLNHRFLKECNGPVESLQLECLKLAVGAPTILEETPAHLERDISVFAVHDVITGPLNATLMKGSKWHIPDYPKVQSVTT